MLRYREEAQRTLRELRKYGVMHGDEDDSNLTWNVELQRVMIIDLDRAIAPELDTPPADDDDSEQARRKRASDEFGDLQQAKRVRV